MISIKTEPISALRQTRRKKVMKLGGTAELKSIYAEVEKIAGELIAKNNHWQAKIRQQLQIHFTNVKRGVWAV